MKAINHRDGPPGISTLHDGAVFSTGQVAYFCRVAPRTVSKWVDGGKLRGYKLPGSQDRRVQRGDLLAFMRSNAMPTDLLEEACGTVVLWCGDKSGALNVSLALGDGWSLLQVNTAVAVGITASTHRPSTLVVDFGYVARPVAVSLVRELKAALPDYAPRTAALAVEDDGPDIGDVLAACGFQRWFRRPVDPKDLADWIRGTVQ